MRTSNFAILMISLAVPAVLLACGGQAVSAGGTTDDGGVVISHGRVPLEHRTSHLACGAPIPGAGTSNGHADAPPPCPAPDPSLDTCKVDGDCTAGVNGKCRQPCGGGKTCSYDLCQSDADCSVKSSTGLAICSCGATNNTINVCTGSGNCQVDADCNGSYCSPSLGSCGTYGGRAGFFCHTDQDECVDDADCKNYKSGQTSFGAAPYCAFDSVARHWKCSDSMCAG